MPDEIDRRAIVGRQGRGLIQDRRAHGDLRPRVKPQQTTERRLFGRSQDAKLLQLMTARVKIPPDGRQFGHRHLAGCGESHGIRERAHQAGVHERGRETFGRCPQRDEANHDTAHLGAHLRLGRDDVRAVRLGIGPGCGPLAAGNARKRNRQADRDVRDPRIVRGIHDAHRTVLDGRVLPPARLTRDLPRRGGLQP